MLKFIYIIFHVQCSVSCGGDGVQSRRVTCEQGSTHILQDTLCNSTERPLVRQACNNGPCQSKRRWRVDPWQSVRRNRWYERYNKMLQERRYREQLRIRNQVMEGYQSQIRDRNRQDYQSQIRDRNNQGYQSQDRDRNHQGYLNQSRDRNRENYDRRNYWANLYRQRRRQF